jgi:uncharacterized delta-60 repeat protein
MGLNSKTPFFIAIGLFLMQLCHAQYSGAIDPTFAVSPGIGGGFGVFPSVQDIKLQQDGKILIGGSFSSYNGADRRRIARLNADGSLDETFNPGSGADFGMFGHGVDQIAIQNDEKILICGDFYSYNGNSTPNHLARLNSDGSYDFSFSTPYLGLNMVNRIAIQDDQKILVSGTGTNYSYGEKFIRLNTDGSIDSSFNVLPGWSLGVSSIFVQDNGKILVSGQFSDTLNPNTIFLLRLNNDGSKDNGFNGDNSGFADYAIQLSSGKILKCGYHESTSKKIQLLEEYGAVDNSFYSAIFSGDFSYSYIMSFSEMQNGKIVVVGGFTSYDSIPANGVIVLNANGTRDLNFNTGTGCDLYGYISAVQNENKILIGGGFSNFNGVASKGIARIQYSELFTPSEKTISEPDNISIWPNPVADNLSISAASPIVDIQFYNGLGNLIKNINHIKPDFEQKIDFSQFAEGIYRVVVNTKTGIKHSNLLKSK